MNTIIIVEGKSDTRRLKEVLDNVQTFETSGLGLDQDKIDKIKKLSTTYKLIVFTDPDGPGEIIRQRLIENIDNLYHAYLPNEKALSKKLDKIGIEHASKEDILNALSNTYQLVEQEDLYTMDDIVDMGLYNNKARRMEFCNKINIAYGNNKKVLKQLNSFAIKPNIIADVLKELE